MNYLAHIYLSRHFEEEMVGNFMTDFIKGKDKKIYPANIKKGIILHRQIDYFTDTHSIVKESIELLKPHYHKFSSVLIDIFYDHFLAKNWESYEQEPLPIFSQRVYQIIKNYTALLPENLQKTLPYVIQYDWLTSYAALANIEEVLKRLEKRISFENNVSTSIEHLKGYYEIFEKHFSLFFPTLIKFVENNRG